MRICPSVETASQFLRRYSLDTLARIKDFARVRARGRVACHGIVTSPPHPGSIDYHEQHRCAHELLGLEDRRAAELGSAERGTSGAAIDAYTDGSRACPRAAPRCRRGALRS